jgi:hypothetical protein
MTFLQRLLTLRSLLGAILLGLLWWLGEGLGNSPYILAIDPITAALILGGIGVAGGVGSQLALGGGEVGSPELGDFAASGFVPGADPILAALQREQLIQQGVDPGQAGIQGSPVMRFLQAPLSGTAGVFRADAQQVFAQEAEQVARIVREGLAQGLGEDEILQNALQSQTAFGAFDNTSSKQLALAAGFSGVEDLVRQQIAFERERPEEAARAREQLGVIRAGRDAATRGISQILQDFPVPTQAAIDDLAGTFEADFRRDRLQQANVGGFPADLRNIEREGLLQALGVFGGQQQLAGGALSALQGAETQNLLNALAVQERGQAAQLGAAQLAGAQAQSFNQLGTQVELANLASDQEQANQLTNLFGTLAGGGFELAGAGTGAKKGSKGGGAPGTG